MLNLFQHFFFTTFVMMNKKIIFSAILLAFIASCDYIAIPKEEYTPIPAPEDTIIRKILLEDYTGHRCPSCPNAHVQANSLKQQYGEQLVVIGVHAGSTSIPNPPLYLVDYRTTAGNAYDLFFTIPSYPKGMINRFGYPANANLLNWGSAWSTTIASLVSLPVEANIEISFTLNGNLLDVTAKTQMLAEKTGPYKIVALITEDSIVSPQDVNTIY